MTKVIRVRKNQVRMYYENGVLHRLDKPAVENPDGSGESWINGVRQPFNYEIVEEAIEEVKVPLPKVKKEVKPKVPNKPLKLVIKAKHKKFHPNQDTIDNEEDLEERKLTFFMEKLSSHFKNV